MGKKKKSGKDHLLAKLEKGGETNGKEKEKWQRPSARKASLSHFNHPTHTSNNRVNRKSAGMSYWGRLLPHMGRVYFFFFVVNIKEEKLCGGVYSKSRFSLQLSLVWRLIGRTLKSSAIADLSAIRGER